MANEKNKEKPEIDELRARYERLKDKRIVAQNNLENADKQLAALRAHAQEQWGTDDVEELKRKLAEMRAENEQRVKSYREHLDKIESDLREVENRHDGSAS